MIERTEKCTGLRLRREASGSSENGSAIVPALLVASMLAMLGLSMLQASISGSKIVNHQVDEYQLASSVESAAILTADNIWSAYLRSPGRNGSAGDIQSFRQFLDAEGFEDIGLGAPPGASDGVDMLAETSVPGALAGHPELDNVSIDAMRVARRDDGESTQLFITVSASTQRAQGVAEKPMNRAIQVVYTVEPAQFEGFDYGILTNNVNCVFCHTVVDSADRFYNTDPSKHGTFSKVKVGSLESLSLRNSGDGKAWINDNDADSVIAGSLYVRGKALDEHGDAITNWSALTLRSFLFGAGGLLEQDANGDMQTTAFSPAGTPPLPGENLYLDYPVDYADMPDGKLPTAFPPPFPDNGGVRPSPRLANTARAQNRPGGPPEFYPRTQDFEGVISEGTIHVSTPGQTLGSSAALTAAMTVGNNQSLGAVTNGNVVLTGTADNPIRINGEVAIDGDLVISGYVEGDGSLWVKGNVYIPSDLVYLDQHAQDVNGNPGPRLFGIGNSSNGSSGVNALGLVSVGNVLIGDFLKPSIFSNPGEHDIITGAVGGGFNYALSEIAIFNRNEWAKTQPFLPGPNSTFNDTSTWTISNPNYDANYTPRYYQFGEGNQIPIYNKGGMYFDTASNSWHTPREAVSSWATNAITIADPNNPADPILYNSDGTPRAVLSSVTPADGWIDWQSLKDRIEEMQANRLLPSDAPLEIDGLLYTNNAIFGISHRNDSGGGSMTINGSLVCADLGLLAPGKHNPDGNGTSANAPRSPYKVGLQLNYDRRISSKINVLNPFQVTIRRSLWRPMANIL